MSLTLFHNSTRSRTAFGFARTLLDIVNQAQIVNVRIVLNMQAIFPVAIIRPPHPTFENFLFADRDEQVVRSPSQYVWTVHAYFDAWCMSTFDKNIAKICVDCLLLFIVNQ
jgi:hypothetical protein